MSRVRIVFLGTPEIARTCLEAMFNDEHYEIVGVVTQPDRPAGRKLQLQPSLVKQFAVQHNIPVLSPENINRPDVLSEIDRWRAECAVVVAFGQILKKEFLNMYPKKVVNVHASILPHLRGAAPIQRAIMNGDLESGVSLQVMVRKLDAGPLLGVRRYPIPLEMNAIESYKKCEELGQQLLIVELMDYLRGNLHAIPQDESKVTLAPKIDKSEAHFDWKFQNLALHNLVRGLAMGPVAQTTRDGKIIKLHKTLPSSAHSSAVRAGQVTAVTDKSLIVQCGQGSLELLEIQPESGKKMSVSDYMRGNPVKPGDVFGEKR